MIKGVNMEISTVNNIIAGTIGLITGAIGSLVAPWINWGIEKRRKRNERRIELIGTWRKIISNNKFDRRQLLNDPTYGALCGLLQQEVRKEIERPNNIEIIDVHSPTESYDRDLLLREIARIENHWKLI
jgi:hypothetical protein